MKVEEFLDNYEYKVTKRLVKKEFPYVIDIIPTESFEDYKTLSFVFVVINPQKFMEVYSELDLRLYGYLEYLSQSFIPGYIYGSSLDFFFNYDKSRNSSPDFKSIENDIRDTIDSVHKSESIPKDLKLYGEIAVSGYMVPVKLINY